MNQVTQDMNIMYKEIKSYYTRDALKMNFNVKRYCRRDHVWNR